jgi:DNA-directed RNA polymerase subunit RPC12/RpoP
MAVLEKTICPNRNCNKDIYIVMGDLPRYGPVKDQSCRYCGFKFTGTEEWLVCQECNTKFLIRTEMERPFRCPECGFGVDHYTPSEVAAGKDKSPLRILKKRGGLK